MGKQVDKKVIQKHDYAMNDQQEINDVEVLLYINKQCKKWRTYTYITKNYHMIRSIPQKNLLKEILVIKSAEKNY